MTNTIEATLLTNNKSGGASSFNTASISPKRYRLYLLIVMEHNSGVGNPAEPTASGCNMTWTKVVTKVNESNADQRITLFRAMGPNPTAGAVTINGGGTITSIFWGITEFTNVKRTGATYGADGVPQSGSKSESNADPMSMTITLSAFGDAKNATFAACISPDAPTLPSGFTNLFTDAQDLGPDNSVRACWKNGNSTSTIFTSTGGGAGEATGVACEIAYSPYSTGGSFLLNFV